MSEISPPHHASAVVAPVRVAGTKIDETFVLSASSYADTLSGFRDGRAQFVYLPRVFDPGQLPETPKDFLPVPTCRGVTAAMQLTDQLLVQLGFRRVAYVCENGGAPYVSIVFIPGESRATDKSRGALRGHTDAASFPFAGERDASDPRIAPAPDVVALIGLRNPRAVRTTLMPLPDILRHLNATQIEELVKAQYFIRCQPTFTAGTKRRFGGAHVAFDAGVLRIAQGRYEARFSHKGVDPDQGTDGSVPAAAKDALDAFIDLLPRVATQVVVSPGDVLLINNRTCLHGRETVLDDSEGYDLEGRWLLRTYGLRASAIAPEQWVNEPEGVLYP